MNQIDDNGGKNYVFIVGCGRSGTTFLGDVLGRHPEILNWYEPDFIWNWHTGNLESDVRTEAHLTEKGKWFIRREFSLFKYKSGAKFIIDKSPLNSFKIPYILGVFPKSRWIHLIRDGRDVTLSLNKEWNKRKHIVAKKNIKGFVSGFKRMIASQPFWRNRFQSVYYEIRNLNSPTSVFSLNKSKWEGKIGYGARFPGWKDYCDSHSIIEFNAMQWVKSVEAVKTSLGNVPGRNWIEIKYENFLIHPRETLIEVLNFIGGKIDEDFFKSLPPIKRNNFNKWEKEFTPGDLKKIDPILTPKLIELGYEGNS
jgi:hypothetical protein